MNLINTNPTSPTSPVQRGAGGGFLISAAASNSGKTTLTIGLLRALCRRGLRVQPYKCGPDYIDPLFHRQASGRTSVNLDTFMASDEHIRQLYSQYGQEADVRVVEGVMGLFDGYDKWHGSSAQLAQLLNLPVVLVVSAKSTAYSVAPLLYGFRHFNPSVHVAGVIFNQVASSAHYNLLIQAAEDAGVPCMGYLPRNPQLVIPGRHLGLTISTQQEMEELINRAADEVDAHVELDKLLAL